MLGIAAVPAIMAGLQNNEIPLFTIPVGIIIGLIIFYFINRYKT
jgi:hypothetical protein